MKKYFMIDFQNINDITESNTVMVEDKDLVNLINNYDKKNYDIVNITGMGFIITDYKEFLKTDPQLELGK